jgi:hypothetical protein
VTPGHSIIGRLLAAALMLLAAAYALHYAVGLVLSVLWPLIGMAGAVVVAVAAWQLWSYHRSRW